MRLFLNANVLFSAAKSDGAIRRLLTLAMKRGCECWVNGYVVEEARRNLVRKSPQSVPDLVEILGQLQVASVQSQVMPKDSIIAWLPEKDRPVLAAAIALRCDGLVTGDRAHFSAGYGKVYGGVTVYSPSSLTKHLLHK